MLDMIKKQIIDSYIVKQKILGDSDLLNIIQQVALKIIEAYKTGNKVLVAGNGGSAADAQHMVGEFVSKFYFDRPGLPAMALTTDTSILTAIGNDYGYNRVFARQVQANAAKGDVFLGISTSGNSENIIEALKVCKQKGVLAVGLVGENKCEMDQLCDYVIKIPSKETPRIQEAHILIEHIICSIVEKAIFGEGF